MSLENELVQRLEEALSIWLPSQRRALADLVERNALTAEASQEALNHLVESMTDTLLVERASVWRLRDDADAIDCLALFERTSKSCTRGAVITRTTAPRYFEALSRERVIAAHDARADERTSEFVASYLDPLGISSMLDAPVFVRGRAIGVVCLEHVGPKRTFHFWEELVAATFADLAGAILDGESRLRDLASARAQEERLRSLVDERTRALAASRESLRTLLDAAPVPLSMTRTRDHRVIYANARARELFSDDGVATDLKGNEGVRFWVDPKDRAAFVERVLREGRVDGYEAELLTPRGRRFWARVDARSLEFEGENVIALGMIDITEQRRLQQALRALLDAAPVPLLVVGFDDDVVRYSNGPASRLFERGASNLVGADATRLFADEAAYRTLRREVDEAKHVEAKELRLASKSEVGTYTLVNAKVFELEGESLFMLGFTDLTVQKEQERRLERLATTDELTDATNRRHFFELGEREVARAERYGSQVALGMIDVDFFKRINDQLGHDAGDAVLKELVVVLREQLRTVDLVARVGGEEFVVLLPETSLDDGERTLERVRAAVEARAFSSVPTGRKVTVSIGVAAKEPGDTLSSLLKRADSCLYRAKEEGRNRVSRAPRATSLSPPAS